MIRTIAFLSSLLLITTMLQAEHVLWFDQSAADWNQALPVGNGRMGAMVFGDPETDRIQLNEDSMWAGELKDVKLSIGTPADLAVVRKLIDEDRLEDADREIVKRFSRNAVLRSHQTLGDLYIDWKHTAQPVTEYRRQLDLTTAIATATWRRGETTFTEEVFCSNPDEAIFIKLTAVGAEALDFDLRLDRPLDQGVKTHQLKASQKNDAKSLLMSGQVTQQRAMLQGKPVEGMKGVRFAVKLDAEASPELAKLPTDQRLARLRKEDSDPGLDALIFHYGRYLLIASSRTSGNPANLQGLWNPHIEAPWNNDYHLNINVQMNYWPAEVTNLSETHQPVLTWMQRLAANGAVTAKQQYGMRGWMAHHATELFGQTVMKSARANWGGWIHGGGWMCQHIWTHYDDTRDEDFLRETGYPLLAGQSRFYLDWLVEKDGKLVSYPETSPENGFLSTDGKYAASCAKAAMGQQIITEVFTNTLAAARELGIDDELTKEIEAALPKLDRGQHIGPDGRLLEWDKPREENEPGHRHMSHLYGFHPGISITQEKTPELLAAAKKSIAFREQHGSVGTGWSRAWAISMYARFRDGQTAHHHLREMLRTQTLNNGFNSIFGSKRPLFQIEANLRATAGVAEMLMQSHGGFIHLLPALPEAWPNGSVNALRARGGHTIDISWKDGKLDKAAITKGPGILPAIQVQNTPANNDPRISIR